MYENNIFKEQAWELKGAENVGITISMFRFMLSFFASVGIGALLRFVPTTAGDFCPYLPCHECHWQIKGPCNGSSASQRVSFQ